MSKAIAGLIVYAIFGILYGVGKGIIAIFEWISNIFSRPQREREAQQRKIEREQADKRQAEQRKIYQEQKEQERKEREKKEQEFIDNYKGLTAEEILLKGELDEFKKIRLLREIYKYNLEDTRELIKASERAQKKARLDAVKRKVTQKARELYGNIPSDYARKPIPDDVKMFVWQRDGGECIKCGSNENLEFDHIIPIVKGGSNTERNIQLFCEKCNREKQDNIQ
jgi:hypothetical protein